jgi:hypothetical protein
MHGALDLGALRRPVSAEVLGFVPLITQPGELALVKVSILRKVTAWPWVMLRPALELIDWLE